MNPEKSTAQPHRFKSAVKWAFVMNWGPNIIATLLTFVLAACLGKENFGVVGMALLYIAFVQIFLEGGLGAAIVQRLDLDPEHLDAVFWITLAFSMTLFTLTWLISPYWAAFNHTPQLSLVLRVEAFTLPLQGLTVVQESLLEKKLDFKSLAVRSNLSTLFGGIFGLVLALTGFGVWALVAEDLLAAVARVVLLWRLGDWRPSFRFSYRHIKDLSGFSFYVMFAQIGNFVQRRSDALLVGHFFGAAAVGVYQMADRLINIVIEMATRPLIMVVMPHFSRLQNQMVELRKSVMQCFRSTAMLTMPLLAMLAGCAGLICAALSAYKQNWNQAIHVIQILSLVGAARAVTLLAGPLMQSLNRPRQFMTMSWMLAILNTVAFCIAGYLLENKEDIEKQAMGVATVRAIIFCFIYTPICFVIIARLCKLNLWTVGRSILPAIGVSAVVTTVGVLITHALLDFTKHHDLPGPLWIEHIAPMIIGGALTGTLAITLMLTVEPDLRDFIMQRLGRKRPAVQTAAVTPPIREHDGATVDFAEVSAPVADTSV